MNIFYINQDPKACAQEHCDKHVVKMILESAQLLSTAHRIIDGTEEQILSRTGRKQKYWTISDDRETVMYKATHMNHPSAIWCRATSDNYKWLHQMTVNLCEEYTHRYGKVHACQRSGLIDRLHEVPKNLVAKVGFTEMPQAMPDHCKVPGNPLQGYRNYYIIEKSRFAKWTKRQTPSWFVVK